MTESGEVRALHTSVSGRADAVWHAFGLAALLALTAWLSFDRPWSWVAVAAAFALLPLWLLLFPTESMWFEGPYLVHRSGRTTARVELSPGVHVYREFIPMAGFKLAVENRGRTVTFSHTDPRTAPLRAELARRLKAARARGLDDPRTRGLLLDGTDAL